MNTWEWLVWRGAGVLIALFSLFLVWLGLSSGLDLGWLFIAAFFAVLASMVWKNAD